MSDGEADIKGKLERMLNVRILRVEENEDGIVVYVPEDQVRIAVGSGGSAVRAAELVIGRHIEVKGE
ncbi:MAG: transcription elongation factor NusA [Thermococci archaeon]|nr:transcription elongation factor NusA [Thermococci archaeon]